MEISKKMLGLNILLSQAILIVIALGLWVILRLFDRKIVLAEMFTIDSLSKAFIALIIGCAVLIALQFLFLKYVPKERLFDEINLILMEKFSLTELLPLFFLGAFSEEFLFRGMIQPVLGLCLTAVVFTLIHYRYWRQVFILVEVFLMGILLGVVYAVSLTLWVPVLCHFIVNMTTAFWIKKGTFELI
ncbi:MULTISPECIES: type II CAAX endopeptidase family protein [unclassified Dehalobacter]|uniref:CPBP family intramembrane glutamic endopeptidase n=1 Tax=unclassified Dehalobacter TaxID=2635733 RepID=UPI000E6CEEEF|nr:MULTISPECIES: type II CAAX endopeptidase family protein [unclassified Dehalobacter]RJE48453.1 hypothetical protein A7K50_11285 [Dehalobacter sp. MCB1]TCX50522.1 CPBP family intramembrane metalloprotease [Dehalobacter sp. 14DCB1]TCX52238.1 CPBP family intramembrane metalloprotease [Dehalobacter sp. 12DCB1]